MYKLFLKKMKIFIIKEFFTVYFVREKRKQIKPFI